MFLSTPPSPKLNYYPFKISYVSSQEQWLPLIWDSSWPTYHHLLPLHSHWPPPSLIHLLVSYPAIHAGMDGWVRDQVVLLCTSCVAIAVVVPLSLVPRPHPKNRERYKGIMIFQMGPGNEARYYLSCFEANLQLQITVFENMIITWCFSIATTLVLV